MITPAFIEQFAHDWLGHRIWPAQMYRRQALSRAITRAYAVFAQKYPDQTASFFDEHFLAFTAKPLLDCYVKGTPLPDPAKLANAWAKQLRWVNEETRQRAIAGVTPAATDFLRLLETELASTRS